jgi:hypothetical protein
MQATQTNQGYMMISLRLNAKAFDREYMGKIPALQTQLGLQFTLPTCTDRDLGDVKVILCKQDRGADPISHKKTRDKLVKLPDNEADEDLRGFLSMVGYLKE